MRNHCTILILVLTIIMTLFSRIYLRVFNIFILNFVVETDILTFGFGGCLLIIRIIILLFINFYLIGEVEIKGFVFWFFVFLVRMFLLIFSKNILILFTGWEGLGISSFYLVYFYSAWGPASSAVKTVLINKIGDLFFVLFLVLVFFFDLNYRILIMFIVCLFCFTKSAIFPFSFWLPNAITAPTPISALVHSSTLVAAGLWILISSFGVFRGGLLILVFGVVTSLVGGGLAIIERDFKKLVAYSTLSQLGFILISFSLISSLFGLIHLLIHALFKSLLFVCVGIGILASYHNQLEIKFSLPKNNYIYSLFLFSGISLISFPFFLGFFSKHLILSSFCLWGWGTFICVLFLLSVLVTTIYSIRILNCVFKTGCVGIAFSYRHVRWFFVVLCIMCLTKFSLVAFFYSSFVINLSSLFFLFGLIFFWIRKIIWIRFLTQIHSQKIFSTKLWTHVVLTGQIEFIIDWAFVRSSLLFGYHQKLGVLILCLLGLIL